MKELYNLLIFGILGTIFFFGPIWLFYKLNIYFEKKGMGNSNAGVSAAAVTFAICLIAGFVAMSIDY